MIRYSRVPIVLFCDDPLSLRHLIPLHRSGELTVVALQQEEFFASSSGINWKQQETLDPETHIGHGSSLYSVWFEKPFFVRRAIESGLVTSPYVGWMDAGLIRTRTDIRMWDTWPDNNRVARLTQDRLHILQLKRFSRAERRRASRMQALSSFAGQVRLGGGLMIGADQAWKAWADQFMLSACEMADAGHFVGKDQDVMANVALRQPNLVRLWPTRLCPESIENPWHDLLYRFSREGSRYCPPATLQPMTTMLRVAQATIRSAQS